MEKPAVDPVSYIRSKRTGMLIPVYDEDDTIVVLANIKAASGERETKFTPNPVATRSDDNQLSATQDRLKKRDVSPPPEKSPEIGNKNQKDAGEHVSNYSLRGGSSARRRRSRDEEKEEPEKTSDAPVTNGLRSSKRHAGNRNVDDSADVGNVRRLRGDNDDDERPSKKSKNSQTADENAGSKLVGGLVKKLMVAAPVAGASSTPDDSNDKFSKPAMLCIKKIMSRKDPPTHIQDLLQILREMCPNENLPPAGRAKPMLELQGYCLLRGARNATVAPSNHKEKLPAVEQATSKATFTPEMETFIRDFFRTHKPQETYGLEISELLKQRYKCPTGEAVINRALKTMGFQVKSCPQSVREQVLAEIHFKMSRENDKSTKSTAPADPPRVQPLRISRNAIYPSEPPIIKETPRPATPSFFSNATNLPQKPVHTRSSAVAVSQPTVARKRLKSSKPSTAVTQESNKTADPLFHHDLRRKRASDTPSTMPSPDTASSSSSNMQPPSGPDPPTKLKTADAKPPAHFVPDARRKFASPALPQFISAPSASGGSKTIASTQGGTPQSRNPTPTTSTQPIATSVKRPLGFTISVDMWKKTVIKTLQTAYSTTLQQINDSPDKLGEKRVARAVEILRGAFKYDYQPYVVLNMASRHLGIDLRKPLVEAHLKPYYGERHVVSAPVHVHEPLYAVVTMSSKRSDFDLMTSSTLASSASSSNCYDFVSSPSAVSASMLMKANGLLEIKKDDPFCLDYRGSLVFAGQQQPQRDAAAVPPSKVSEAAVSTVQSSDSIAPLPSSGSVSSDNSTAELLPADKTPVFTADMLPIVKQEPLDFASGKRDLSPSRRSQGSSIVSIHNTPVKTTTAKAQLHQAEIAPLLTPKTEPRSSLLPSSQSSATDKVNDAVDPTSAVKTAAFSSESEGAPQAKETAPAVAASDVEQNRPQSQHYLDVAVRPVKPEPRWPPAVPPLTHVAADKIASVDTNLLNPNGSLDRSLVAAQTSSALVGISSQDSSTDDEIECVFIKAEKPWSATTALTAQLEQARQSPVTAAKKPRVSFKGENLPSVASTAVQQPSPTPKPLSTVLPTAVTISNAPAPQRSVSPAKASFFPAAANSQDVNSQRPPSPTKQRPPSPSKVNRFPNNNAPTQSNLAGAPKPIVAASLPKLMVRSDYKFDKEFASEFAETQRNLFDAINIDDSSLTATAGSSDFRPVNGGAVGGEVADAASNRSNSGGSQLMQHEEDIMILEIFASAASTLEKVASPTAVSGVTVDADGAVAADDKQALRAQLGIPPIPTNVPAVADAVQIDSSSDFTAESDPADRTVKLEKAAAVVPEQSVPTLEQNDDSAVAASSASPPTGQAEQQTDAVDSNPVNIAVNELLTTISQMSDSILPTDSNTNH